MKHLSLENPRHKQLQQGFSDWLELTGYAATSVYGMSNCMREFLHWIEQEHIQLEDIIPVVFHRYFFHLKHRKKQKRIACPTSGGGALSTNYLHKHVQSIKKFSHYLKETGQGSFEIDILLPEQKSKIPEILTKEEIKQLYEACESSPIGLRDRAMVSIYYGCGLRRTEGVSLDITDFLPDKKVLYVRKGKNYRERYVPLTSEIKHDLQEYVNYGRKALLQDKSEPAFFISERGTRPQGQSLIIRLKILASKAGIPKNIGLHVLRHSIATHLLQSGMSLQNIARFLGHASLESTQIYTHIAHNR
jgi:integrase/recombinase XerD